MVSTTACSDAQAPTAPTNLNASNVNQTGLTSTWSASSDSVGVTGYVILDKMKVATVATTSGGAVRHGGITYAFAVSAFDVAGNHSPQTQLTTFTVAPGPLCVCGDDRTHWPDVSDYSQLKSIGYGFAVTNVAPGDVAGAKAKLDAAHNAGIKLIIGLYAFGGPRAVYAQR